MTDPLHFYRQRLREVRLWLGDTPKHREKRMKIDWTDEEIAAGVAAAINEGVRELSAGAIAAVMSRAAQLMSARGGTMTAERLCVLLGQGALSTREGDEVRQHIAALGAKVAGLTEWLADLTEVLCGERPVGVMPSTTLDAARALKAKVAELDAELEQHRNPRHQRQECARERWLLDNENQRDLRLREELGATSGETLRGAVLRVVKERDDLKAESATHLEWMREERTRAETAEADLATYTGAAAHDQKTVDSLRAELASGEAALKHEVEHRRALEGTVEEHKTALRRLDALLCFRTRWRAGDGGVVDPSGINDAFATFRALLGWDDVEVVDPEPLATQGPTSGQVADARELVRSFIVTRPRDTARVVNALDTLAALAQRAQDVEKEAEMHLQASTIHHESWMKAKAELDAAWKAAAVPVREMADLAEVITQLRSTRDEANAQLRAIRERAKDWGTLSSIADKHSTSRDVAYFAVSHVLGGPWMSSTGGT